MKHQRITYAELSDALRRNYWLSNLTYSEKNAWVLTKQVEYYEKYHSSSVSNITETPHTCVYVDGLCTICEPF